MHKQQPIAKKLKETIQKYYRLEVFKEEKLSFYPTCIVTYEESRESQFNDMQKELKSMGFQARFYAAKKAELKEHNLDLDMTKKRYVVEFEAKEFVDPVEKLKRDRKIQALLLGITTALIILSAFFYLLFIEPYYADLVAQDSERTLLLVGYFCLGMFLIIVVHEFGHILFARYHKLNTSLPFLIPGPPPLGMLGAFVKIKDDPKNRNEKFDVAIGGIVCGILISLVFLLIGLSLSEFVDTQTYLEMRANLYDHTLQQEAQDLSEDLNGFNLLFMIVRALMFEEPTYSTYYGYELPDQILVLHPLAYAGWIGLLLSGLNLIPIPMLDGGHALKAVFSGRYTRIVGLIVGGVIFMVLTGRITLLVSLGCLAVAQDLDPSKRVEDVPDPTVPLTLSRKVFAVCLLVLLILLFPLTFENLIYGIAA